MLTEKDLLDRVPVDLRDALDAVLERYQRHLMMLETELAEMRANLGGPNIQISRQRLTVVRPASFRRPHLCRSIMREEKDRSALESAALLDQ